MRISLMTILILVSSSLVFAEIPQPRGTKTAKGEYTPPTQPRTEASHGAIYLELRKIDDAASNAANRLYPQTPFPSDPAAQQAWLKAEQMRNDNWSVAQDRELKRRLGVVAAREKVPVEELVDITLEGNVRAWFADVRQRERLNRSEEEIQRLLQGQRETEKILREKSKPPQKKTRKR